MILEDIVRTGLGSLAAHKLRSALNLLGIIIAVATIVAVISVVSGLNKYAADVISGLGPNTLIFTKFGIIRSREGFLEALKRKDITEADLEAVRRLVPQARRVAGRVLSTHPVYAGGHRLADTFVLGAEYEFPWMIGLELQDGRFFTENEADAGRAVAVIGWDIKDELFPHEDPVGREIKVEGRAFHIIGTMAKQGSTFGQSQDRFVLVPLAAYRHTFGITRSLDIFVEVPDAGSRQPVEDAVRLVLRSRRGTPFSAPDPFGIVDAEALNILWRSITFSAFALVIWISSISLVVGGVAIANTMFASVVERTREIGIRKALGARRRDLHRQFLFEAVAQSFVGGLIGVLLGWLVALGVGHWSPFPARVTAFLVIAGLAVATLSGLLAGWLPAIRAARLDPIVALRDE
ncbi:MAG: ABC transporter permease [Thermoanaerobaculaceae bacterium]|jgi:putative ABC transport system permease protein